MCGERPASTVIVAAFNATTGWLGRTIEYDEAQRCFVLQDDGLLRAGDVVTYDERGQLAWAQSELRDWVYHSAEWERQARPSAFIRRRGLVAYSLHDRLVIGALVFVVVLASLGTFLAHRNYIRPPVGRFVGTSSSPDGRWHLAVYYISFNAGAMSAAGDGLWRVVLQQRGVPVLRERCVYLDYAPPDPASVNITWRGGREAIIASTRVDVATADVHDNEPFSDAQYTWRWIEIVVASGLLWALGLGLTALLAARRRHRSRATV